MSKIFGVLLFLAAAFLTSSIIFPVFAQGGGGPAGIPQIEYIFARIVCVAVPLGYIALLVVLVVAGIKYLTSGGEAKAVAAAHQTVTWGLLGVLFLAIAWLILQLVQTFTGVEVTKFTLASLPGVQGFSGQCFAPAPIAPEPTRPTSNTTASPLTRQQCQPIPEAPKIRICNGLRPGDNGTDPFPECYYRTVSGVAYPVRFCRAEFDCENTPSFFRSSTISDGIYYTSGTIEEALEQINSPTQINILTREATNNRIYSPSMDFFNNAPNLFAAYGRFWGQYRRNTVPEDLIRGRMASTFIWGALTGLQRLGIQRFIDSNPTLVVGCKNSDYYPVQVRSPFIYLYPKEESSISLKINSPIISPNTALENNKSWNITAHPNGTLTTIDGGKKYRYIPYEFLRNDFKRPEKGFVVEGSKLEEYLKNDLWRKLGLTDSEINDYWLDTKPRIKPSPYYFISLIDRSEIDRVLPMEVNPKPDTILRNMTYILPLPSKPTQDPKPLPIAAPERKGFTVLENGVFTDGF